MDGVIQQGLVPRRGYGQTLLARAKEIQTKKALLTEHVLCVFPAKLLTKEGAILHQDILVYRFPSKTTVSSNGTSMFTKSVFLRHEEAASDLLSCNINM